MKLRWKKNPKETGLRRIGAGPRGSILHDGVKQYASVDPCGGGWKPLSGWYWVAGWGSGIPHYNSCSSLSATEEEAKAEAKEYVLSELKKLI